MVDIKTLFPSLSPGNPADLKSRLNISGGPAQACQYVCNIFPPRSWFSLLSIGGLARSALAVLGAQHVSVMAESCSIPGRQLLTTPHKIQGTLRQMPYGVVYPNININFICTNFMYERTFFDMWHQYVMGPSSQYMNYYEEYVGQIVIQKISNDTDITGAKSIEGIASGAATLAAALVSTYIIEDAYPVTIQAQEMSYEDQGYLKLNVEFAYSRWRNTLDRFADDSPTDKATRLRAEKKLFES